MPSLFRHPPLTFIPLPWMSMLYSRPFKTPTPTHWQAGLIRGHWLVLLLLDVSKNKCFFMSLLLNPKEYFRLTFPSAVVISQLRHECTKLVLHEGLHPTGRINQSRGILTLMHNSWFVLWTTKQAYNTDRAHDVNLMRYVTTGAQLEGY